MDVDTLCVLNWVEATFLSLAIHTNQEKSSHLFPPKHSCSVTFTLTERLLQNWRWERIGREKGFKNHKESAWCLKSSLHLKITWRSDSSQTDDRNWIPLNQTDSVYWLPLNPTEPDWIIWIPTESDWLSLLTPSKSDWIRLIQFTDSLWIPLSQSDAVYWWATEPFSLRKHQLLPHTHTQSFKVKIHTHFIHPVLTEQQPHRSRGQAVTWKKARRTGNSCFLVTQWPQWPSAQETEPRHPQLWQ